MPRFYILKFMKDLAKRLNGLPIEVGKVQLWLVYRRLKPMASVVLDFDWESDDEEREKLEDWFKDAGVVFKKSQRNENTLHVSLDENVLEKHALSELDESAEAHLLRGKLYGFPEGAALAYSEVIEREDLFPNEKVIHAPKVLELRDKYWYQYIEYLVRRGHEFEDSMVAKTWADVVRKEIPEVAQEYEKERLEGLRKMEAELKKIYKK